MTEIMPVPENLILLSYQQGAAAALLNMLKNPAEFRHTIGEGNKILPSKKAFPFSAD